jgi:hypothetical protein
MTGTDVAGFLDLNDTIAVYDDKGNYICTFTGREVLCSFSSLKMDLPSLQQSTNWALSATSIWFTQTLHRVKS